MRKTQSTSDPRQPRQPRPLMVLATLAVLLMCVRCGDEPPELGRLAGQAVPGVPSGPEETPAGCALEGEEIPRCAPVYEPTLLAMGVMAPGESATSSMWVHNTGDGDCLLETVEITGCRFNGANFECGADILTSFDLSAAPEVGARLRPGESAAFDIRFEAPAFAEFSLARLKHHGRLTTFFADPCHPGALRAPPWGGSQGVNLRAEVTGAYATVEPAFVDFGLTGTSCPSVTREVTIANVGPTPYTVESLSLSGCGAVVTWVDAPTTPFTMEGFSQRVLELAFDPAGTGSLTCELIIMTSAPNLERAVLKILGQSTELGHHVETFLPDTVRKLDVLFVIDDSNSMSNEQAVLAEELPKLALEASAAGSDYHLAVTTTDAGLRNGVFLGEPTLPKIENLVFANLRGGGLVLHVR